MDSLSHSAAKGYTTARFNRHGKGTLLLDRFFEARFYAPARYKDNRIPPKSFHITQAEERLCEPVWEGRSAPHHFTKAEYEGGYHDVSLKVPTGAAWRFFD